ncbi:MAG: hypothetical protein JXB13_20580 [Phycisphaerae bacterium]|nr:hypothetical protein [Phycisphaerae bacterium]
MRRPRADDALGSPPTGPAIGEVFPFLHVVIIHELETLRNDIDRVRQIGTPSYRCGYW